jgi:glycosyltransferase involved in cell wall biosynthesis
MAWAPFLDPVVLRIAGTRALGRRPDARERLGLAASGRIALFFGSKDSKHPQAVFDAFSTLEGWTLVVAGELVASVDPRANPDVVRSSNRVSNESRDLFLSAADLMVLSFPDDYGHNSGTLMDAISVGVPVVCSARSAPADIVTRYRLGSLFVPDDSASLADAVRRAPAAVDPADLARARADRSNVSVARDQLLAVGLVSPSPASEATTAVLG